MRSSARCSRRNRSPIPTAPANILTEMFARLGIANEMKDKARKIPATPVGEIVTRGDADIGCQQISELKVSIAEGSHLPQNCVALIINHAGASRGEGPDA
jgi:molybdate transport system substrate-binding protein